MNRSANIEAPQLAPKAACRSTAGERSRRHQGTTPFVHSMSCHPSSCLLGQISQPARPLPPPPPPLAGIRARNATECRGRWKAAGLRAGGHGWPKLSYRRERRHRQGRLSAPSPHVGERMFTSDSLLPAVLSNASQSDRTAGPRSPASASLVLFQQERAPATSIPADDYASSTVLQIFNS